MLALGVRRLLIIGHQCASSTKCNVPIQHFLSCFTSYFLYFFLQGLIQGVIQPFLTSNFSLFFTSNSYFKFFLLEYLFFLFLWDFIPRRYWFFLRHFLNQFSREFCHTLNHIHFFQRHKYPMSIRGRKFPINSCALSEKLEKLEDPQNPTAVF